MSNVRIASRTKLLLPKFVDALLGIVCSSQVPFSSVRVRSVCIGPRTLYRPWEEGRGTAVQGGNSLDLASVVGFCMK